MKWAIKKFRLLESYEQSHGYKLYRCFIKRTNSFKGHWHMSIIRIKTNHIKKALEYICKKSKNYDDIDKFNDVELFLK